MTNGIFIVSGRLALALQAVRQCPIANRFAIQLQLIVLLSRNRTAIRAFVLSPFLCLRNSVSAHPASRNISPTNRSAFCSSDSLSSSP